MDFDQRASQLERLAALLQSGAITDSEFASQKNRILNEDGDTLSNIIRENNRPLMEEGEAVGAQNSAENRSAPETSSMKSELAKFELSLSVLERAFFIWASIVAAYWVTSNPESAPQQAALAAQALVLIAIPYCALAAFQRREARALRSQEDE